MENQPAPVEMLPPQEDSVNLRHYWHVILERRWLVITAFISIFVLSLIYLFKATPIYQATARLQIDREQENMLRVEGLTFGTSQEESSYLQTQYKNLLSRTLIESVIKKLNLDRDVRYAKMKDVVRAVADDISVVPIRLSRLVDVKVQHPDKRKSADICNTLVTYFADGQLDRKQASSVAMVQQLRAEANTEKGKLHEAEEALQRYAKSHNQASFEESENIVLQSLKQFKAEWAKAKTETAAAEKIMEMADQVISNNAAIVTIPQVANSPAIQALQKELAVAEAEFADLKKRYKSKHPTFIRAEERIGSLRLSINEQAETIVASMRNHVETAKTTEAELKQLVDDQTQEQLKVASLRIEYDVLKREAEAADVLYKAVLAKMKESDITSHNKINNIRVVDPARVPIRPIKPRIVLTIFLGLIGGLGIAIGLAFFVNYLDDSIKSQDDVETYLRLPFLGYVPNIKTNSVVERDLQAHLHPQSNAAEGFRTLRASISLMPKAERFQVLAVTSTIPSEGKSLVASNLAIVVAQTGLRTLLVDADLRRPSVHKAYQLHSPTGLSSYLTRESDDLDAIVHKTEVPNLHVMCCGAVPATPSELIGSKRMMEFLQAARGRYDRVVLDSPPISAVSDPLIIAAMADGVVFVTKFNKIRREHARKSIQRLQDAGIHIVGIVLNDIDFEGKDSYYYSYYYYQNRYYSSHYRSSGERPKEGAKGATTVAALGKGERNGH
ncbi:MAG: polysaccharide biosynthesis tyrosine autokinase [Verrucomicrobiota bacterium]